MVLLSPSFESSAKSLRTCSSRLRYLWICAAAWRNKSLHITLTANKNSLSQYHCNDSNNFWLSINYSKYLSHLITSWYLQQQEQSIVVIVVCHFLLPEKDLLNIGIIGHSGW